MGYLGTSTAWRRTGRTALAAVATALALAPGAAATAAASTPARIALPDPTPLGAYAGTPAALASAPRLTLRVYLSGQSGRAAAALAVSDPGSRAYGRYLTAAQFQRRYGPTAVQVKTVSDWLTAEGMTVTATTSHYIAVNATAPEVDTAFGTTVIQYDFPPFSFGGREFPVPPEIGTAGGFSVPAAMGGEIAAVTGLQFTALPAAVPAGTAAARGAVAQGAATAGSYHCSQYWGQHTEAIPAAYGRTSAPTQLCGYTPGQLREAYGVSTSRYTGKGVTIAILMNDRSPTMLADANRFFASHGLAGFAPGQYTENAPASVAATCDDSDASQLPQDEPGGGFNVNALEEAIDVESAHITAPAAHVVYVAANCDEDPFGEVQDLLDAANRIVDEHLANVVSGSFSDLESLYSPADGAAWDLTFQQGAIEGIGFDLSSGDAGSGVNPPSQATAICFPSSSPWVTSVGGTTLEIGRNGTAVADYPWGDSATQENANGTGYTTPPPGEFLSGGTGGNSAFFAEPGYQKSVVPAAVATGDGAGPAQRVVPDISANAESSELIGYTGAVTSGVYGQVLEGGTSEATPLFAGLEADAIQAAGHPLGFLNPALYKLNGTAAISDVPGVNPAHPPVVIGAQPFMGDGNDYLTTLGEDQAPLQAGRGYDNETGLGTPGPAFLTAFRRFQP